MRMHTTVHKYIKYINIFSKVQSLSEEAKAAKRPVDLWKLLITDEIVDLIVKYTNDKISEELQKKPDSAASLYTGLTDRVSHLVEESK
jgi:hypothetical protein